MHDYRCSDIIIAMKQMKEIREERKLTQIRLAKMCGVQQATISDIERGRIKSPSVDIAQRIANALCVNIEDLFPVNHDNAV